MGRTAWGAEARFFVAVVLSDRLGGEERHDLFEGVPTEKL